MPTAITSGHQALPPSIPTPHVSLPAVPSHERSELPPAAAQHTNIPTYQPASASELPPAAAQNTNIPTAQPPAAQQPNSPTAQSAQLPLWYGLHYYQTRLKTLGLTTASAKDYGLDVDAQGNILQLVRHFDGSFVEFIPRQFRQKVDSLLAHRSNYQPHLEMFSRILAVTRYHPDYLKDNPGRPKYGNQYGESVRPLPAPRAIKAYNSRTTGGLITFIEGYFKAIALDLAGIESVAFTGITVYRIDPALREYLLRRRPDRIFIMYDNDALDVSSSSLTRSPDSVREGLAPSSVLSSRRNEDFANSARKFATALFSLFSSIDHTCEIVFVMGKPSPPLGRAVKFTSQYPTIV